MNKYRILITLLISCFYFKGVAQFNQNSEGQIVIGTVDSLYSEILQEQREVWVHVPADLDSTKLYPVIYLLNTPGHFYTTTGILKLLEQWDIPKSILVGIPSTDGMRDLTPTNALDHGRKSETSGGAPNFITFIEEELKPYLKSKYPTDNMSTVIGHSIGGLFVVYAYIHHPNVFDNYLAIDPSLWWDSEKLVTQSKELFNKSTRQNKLLYVAVANSYGVDTVKVRKLKSEQTGMLRANLNFHDILVQNSDQLDFTWDYQGTEDHGSIVVPGLYNGLRSLFSWYPFPEMWRFNTPKKYSAKQLTDPFYVHYKKLSVHMKREVKPDWRLINDIGFFMLEGHNLPKKALAYLEMNVKFYPDYSKSYVALGKYYLARKDKPEAIKNYKKAVEIDGNKEAQIKLVELDK